MEIRDATGDDAGDIAAVAEASLGDSYAEYVDESTIEGFVEEWYAPEHVEEVLAEGTDTILVAETDAGVVGFVQGGLVDQEPPAGEIAWLHVHPDHRGQGIAVQLLGRIVDSFESKNAGLVRGLVLENNREGAAFYEHHGFERVDERQLTIEDEAYTELVYRKAIDGAADREVTEPVTGPDGETLHVAYSEAERGNRGSFYAVYETPDVTDRYGWYCGNCGSVAATMDAMGRVECSNCGNRRKATRWDAAYL